MVNWLSNDEEIMKNFPADCTSHKKSSNLDSNEIEREYSDFIGIQQKIIYPLIINSIEYVPIYWMEKKNKREILQLVMTVFDPIGFLSPLISTGKLIMQLCWTEKMDWVEKNDDIHREWKKWIAYLGKINSFEIPCQNFYFRSEEVPFL
ncbi:hypothetical protein JTB14_035471 [Gonioctena quinquepunctata]|nr:hypothetical protein JTB14_035471 [Gonioctena quinquepunctata]